MGAKIYNNDTTCNNAILWNNLITWKFRGWNMISMFMDTWIGKFQIKHNIT